MNDTRGDRQLRNPTSMLGKEVEGILLVWV